MVRNLKIVKVRPRFPTRRWRKKIGPVDVSHTAIATITSVGIARGKAAHTHAQSKRRFAAEPDHELSSPASELYCREPLAASRCSRGPSEIAGALPQPGYLGVRVSFRLSAVTLTVISTFTSETP